MKKNKFLSLFINTQTIKLLILNIFFYNIFNFTSLNLKIIYQNPFEVNFFYFNQSNLLTFCIFITQNYFIPL
ncbi:hypothetical protein B0A61_08110 [Flavobacterium aquatile LMG 4008 = ATCC 11947]|uniref:Uncharacterized protein n=1 Tax=Flavobacterium aquatile LMG 4008 = ATCC 11947 TaxID=1453498 RepID=A0A095V4A5_9FLAO|nr:hypothetical protein LG45_02780 [Flavobacterium aquatile LMG 4008 = ATCC 11947]OXA67166.1 hypothetical protein B0A61_08110 [Flavobacterium aquatile LMG 4008 = ATCC 11947]